MTKPFYFRQTVSKKADWPLKRPNGNPVCNERAGAPHVLHGNVEPRVRPQPLLLPDSNP